MEKGFSMVGKLSAVFGLISLILAGITSVFAAQLIYTLIGYLLFPLMVLSLLSSIVLGVIDLFSSNKRKLGRLGISLGIISLLVFFIL